MKSIRKILAEMWMQHEYLRAKYSHNPEAELDITIDIIFNFLYTEIAGKNDKRDVYVVVDYEIIRDQGMKTIVETLNAAGCDATTTQSPIPESFDYTLWDARVAPVKRISNTRTHRHVGGIIMIENTWAK
jgi:hypothetical protein